MTKKESTSDEDRVHTYWKLIFEDNICPFCESPLKVETWKEGATMDDEAHKELVAKTKRKNPKLLERLFPHIDAYTSHTCPKCGNVGFLHATVIQGE